MLDSPGVFVDATFDNEFEINDILTKYFVVDEILHNIFSLDINLCSSLKIV